jgi:hypothetical protein
MAATAYLEVLHETNKVFLLVYDLRQDLEEDELDRIRMNYSNLAKKAREELKQGISDTGNSDIDKKGRNGYEKFTFRRTGNSVSDNLGAVGMFLEGGRTRDRPCRLS